MSLATRITAERALGAYLSNVTLGSGETVLSLAAYPGRFKGDEQTVVPLSFHCLPGVIGPQGELPDEWAKVRLPAIIVASVRSEPHLCGYDICDVQIVALTTPDEIHAPAQVQARVGFISAVFDEDRLDDVVAALNSPAAAVRDIQFVGLERDGDDHTENGKQLISTMKLKVHAAGLQ